MKASPYKFSRSDRDLLDAYVREHGAIPGGGPPDPDIISTSQLTRRGKPGYRRGDPAAWSSLSDDQRDIINEWYTEIWQEDSRERSKKERQTWAASYFALIPFAVFSAYLGCGGEITMQAVLGAICAWFVYALVFTIAREIFPSSGKKTSVAIRAACVVFAAYAVLHIIFS